MAVIFGAAGSGKSALLAQQCASHAGPTARVSLAASLGHVSVRSGLGAYEADFADPVLEGLAASLTVAAVAAALLQRGGAPPWREFVACLPDGVSVRGPRDLPVVRSRIAGAAPEALAAVAQRPEALSAFAAAVAGARTAPLVAFDDADGLPLFCIQPSLSLLRAWSGGRGYLAVRAGTRLPSRVLAGLPLWQLGAQPLSLAWREHVLAVVERHAGWVRGDLDATLLALARDSVGTAVQLAHGLRACAPENRYEELRLAALQLKALRVGGARGAMRVHGADFEDFLRQVKARLDDEYGRVPGPVEVLIDQLQQAELFPGTRIHSAVAAGAACGALVPSGGLRSSDGATDGLFEIAPLLLFTHQRAFWSSDTAQPVRLSLPAKTLFGRRSHRQPAVVTLCAAGLEGATACMCRLVERDLARRLPGVSAVVHGTTSEARRAIVADLRGLDPAVLFALGRAHALGVPIIAISEPRHDEIVGTLPVWRLHPASASDRVVDDVAQLLGRRGDSGVPRPWRPIPGVVAWLGEQRLRRSTRKAVSQIAQVGGLTCETPMGRSDLLRSLRAQAIVAVSAKAQIDPRAHFAFGCLVAAPMAGHGGAIRRHGFVVGDAELPYADQCGDRIKSISQTELLSAMARIAVAVQNWRRGDA